jgi:hypothetical protein
MQHPSKAQFVKDFSTLGYIIRETSEQKIDELYLKASGYNNWFTRENIKNAFEGIAYLLQEDKLAHWIDQYQLPISDNRSIAVVMAGNIPCVGFHDYLCVLASGHSLIAKTSSQDPYLPRYIHELLCEINPIYLDRVEFTQAQLKGFDAIIATGSDNSARYFEHYFGKYPHIIRKNRSSVAVLSGEETEAELHALGKDIFDYYGLGCRNVSKLLVPTNYDFHHLLNCLTDYRHVLDHHKYSNNYDYNKSIYLVNQVPHLDNGFLLLKEDSGSVSPISVLFYEYYEGEDQLKNFLDTNDEKIQCKVGQTAWAKHLGLVPFGKGQRPELSDYADGIDVMKFLASIG